MNTLFSQILRASSNKFGSNLCYYCAYKLKVLYFGHALINAYKNTNLEVNFKSTSCFCELISYKYSNSF